MKSVRKDKRGVELISDAPPFAHCDTEPAVKCHTLRIEGTKLFIALHGTSNIWEMAAITS